MIEMIHTCEKCQQAPLSVIDARVRREFAILKLQCPTCRKKVKKQYHPDEIDLNDLQKEIYTCTFCGSSNVKIRDERKVNEYGQTEFSHFTTLPDTQTGIHVTCLACRRTKRKVVEYKFLQQVEAEPAKAEPPKVAPEAKVKEIIVCPTCHTHMDGSEKFCDICGQELYCDKCNEYIRANAAFCHECGDTVQMGKAPEVPAEAPAPASPPPETAPEPVAQETMEPPKEKFEQTPVRTCPLCEENLDDHPPDIIFCPKCGQRMNCQKCNAELIEGARYCFKCGTAV